MSEVATATATAAAATTTTTTTTGPAAPDNNASKSAAAAAAARLPKRKRTVEEMTRGGDDTAPHFGSELFPLDDLGLPPMRRTYRVVHGLLKNGQLPVVWGQNTVPLRRHLPRAAQNNLQLRSTKVDVDGAWIYLFPGGTLRAYGHGSHDDIVRAVAKLCNWIMTFEVPNPVTGSKMRPYEDLVIWRLFAQRLELKYVHYARLQRDFLLKNLDRAKVGYYEPGKKSHIAIRGDGYTCNVYLDSQVVKLSAFANSLSIPGGAYVETSSATCQVQERLEWRARRDFVDRILPVFRRSCACRDLLVTKPAFYSPVAPRVWHPNLLLHTSQQGAGAGAGAASAEETAAAAAAGLPAAKRARTRR
eukprot:Rhum_TRINITY_DN13660_c2_g1::Rhum_TRINITY_DN13660_c2_g1_i1::g.62661::m.62661